MLITDEFEWDYPTFEAYVEGMCAQVAAYPSNIISFHATFSPLTVLTLFATWKVGKIALPLNPKNPSYNFPLFTPTMPTPCTPTQVKWDLDQLATYLYTFGSSGKPKIACHTLKNHVLSAQGSFAQIPLTENSCWGLVIPLYHVGALGILFRCYLAKAKVLISKNWSKATHLSLVPTQLYRLIRDGIKLPQMILLGGAPLPSLHSHQNILPTYGMTEMSSQIVTNHKIHPHAEMTLAPDGEVWVRGGVLFQGYLYPDRLKNQHLGGDKATQFKDFSEGSIPAIQPSEKSLNYESFSASPNVDFSTDRGINESDIHLPLNSQGWFETGDFGVWKEGCFEIIGRKDNLFISGGENIQPEEVEAAIRELCGVEEVIVIPLKDEEFGYRPGVFLKDPSLLPLIQSKLIHIIPKFKIPIRAFLLPEDTGLKPNRKKLLIEARAVENKIIF